MWIVIITRDEWDICGKERGRWSVGLRYLESTRERVMESVIDRVVERVMERVMERGSLV